MPEGSNMGETDMVLLARYAGTRDAEAFAELARRYAGVVYGTCLRVLGNTADAEDVAQDCFLELARRAPKVRGAGGSLAGFLHALARSRSVDFVKQASRRRKRERHAAGQVSHGGEWSAIEQTVDAAMEQLPHEMRELLVVHFLCGATQAEMAEAAGVDQATISRRLSRAVGLLRDKLAGQGVEVSATALGGLMTEHVLQQAPQAVRAGLGKLALSGVGKAATVGIGMKLATAGLVAVAAAGTIVVVANREPASRPVAVMPAMPATTRAVEVELPSVEEARRALEADLEALRQKGEPVRPEDFVRPPVKDAENAVLDLEAAAKSIEGSKALHAYDDIGGLPATPLSRQHAGIVRALVKENAPALKLVKSALAKGKVDWQNRYATPMLAVRLPGLSRQRMLANVLYAAALLAHEDGDDMAALEHVRELLFVGRASGDQPFLVCHLVEVGIDAIAVEVCRQISPSLQVGKDAAMQDQVRRTIADLLDETDGTTHMRRAMQGERITQTDTALALASGTLKIEDLLGGAEQQGDFRRLVIKPADRLPIVLVDARIMLGEMTKNVDASSAADLPTAEAKLKPWPPSGLMEPKRHFYMRLMLPSLEKAFATHHIGLARRRLAATALAIRWYAMDHAGKLPQTLQDLVLTYLPAVPPDPMTVGGSLIYSPDDAVVYSVGVDGKDDGGNRGDGKSRSGDIVMPLR